MGMMAFFTRRDPAAWAMRPETQREAIVASLLAWAWAVEARDPWTGGHLWRVARYTELLADRAGMGPQERAQVALAAFVHDLGKLAVPEAILRQREPLSEAAHAVMRTHPEMGARLLAGHPYGPLVHDIVLLHHETPDGRGYPRGLSGPTIPTGARMVGLLPPFGPMPPRPPLRPAARPPPPPAPPCPRRRLAGHNRDRRRRQADATLRHLRADHGATARTPRRRAPALPRLRRPAQAGGRSERGSRPPGADRRTHGGLRLADGPAAAA